MITKITIDQPTKKAYEPKRFEFAWKAAHEQAEAMAKIASMLLYLAKDPETTPATLIALYMPNEHVNITTYTKKRRVYMISYLYIHDED